MIEVTIRIPGPNGYNGHLKIVNDTSGTPEIGNYDCTLTHGRLAERFRVEGFERSMGVQALVAMALIEYYESQQDKRPVRLPEFNR